MNVSTDINPTLIENHAKDRVTKAKQAMRGHRMKILILAFLLGLASTIAHAECTEYMQAFNKHQLVIKGMINMNFQGKMNAETGDAIGERLQEAQGLMDQGQVSGIVQHLRLRN